MKKIQYNLKHVIHTNKDRIDTLWITLSRVSIVVENYVVVNNIQVTFLVNCVHWNVVFWKLRITEHSLKDMSLGFC